MLCSVARPPPYTHGSKHTRARGGQQARAPLLELGVEGGVVAVAHLLEGAVEVLHVSGVDPVGRDVGAAAKPPLAGDAVPVLSLEVAAGGGQNAARARSIIWACRAFVPSPGNSRAACELVWAARLLRGSGGKGRRTEAPPPRSPVVEVHGGAVRVLGVHHAADGRGEERHAAGAKRRGRCKRRRQARRRGAEAAGAARCGWAGSSWAAGVRGPGARV